LTAASATRTLLEPSIASACADSAPTIPLTVIAKRSELGYQLAGRLESAGRLTSDPQLGRS
jgi:hypothetical protein